MRKWAKVAAVAERQHLLIAAWQLRALGVTDAELKERVDHQGWKRKTHGVIALPGRNRPEAINAHHPPDKEWRSRRASRGPATPWTCER